MKRQRVMADIALATVIRKTADILANLAVEECTRFYWIKEDIRWIQTELEFVQSFLRDAEVNQGNSERMDTLLKEARDLAYEIEDIIDTYFAKIPTFRTKRLLRYLEFLSCIFCDWYTKNKFVMKIQAIKRRIENINRARTTYGITDGSDSRVGGEERDPRRSFPHVDQPSIVGFETHIEELEMLLQQNTRFCMISIVGLPGVGKTTLAKEVYNSVKANFNCRAWVYASQKPRVLDLSGDIARQVGVRKEEWENNADMEANLFEFLRQKRYLIVIDDIWSTETWDALKIGIPNDCTNGSALIISSRHKRVGVYAGGDNSLYELQPLDDEKSWELFSKIVKLPSHSPNETSDYPELLKLGRQISRRCGGLPLTVVVMAGLLSSTEDRIEHRWKALLNKMGDEEDQYLNILSLSYGDLPSHLKPCFLYFGLFPEDHLFPASELINLWIAEGFIKPRERQTLEDEAEGYLTELIRRNLIQIDMERYDRRIRSFRIHDVVHSLCISIAKRENMFNISHGDYSVFNAKVRRISIHNGSISEYFSSTHKSPKLRTLLYFNKDREISRSNLDYIHKGFRLIRVLCLEGVVCPQSFPNEIGNLVHLRYLQLRRSKVRSLPSTINNLKNLHTLDVQDCKGLILPTVIWKMQHLRHILLSDTTSFRHPLISRHVIKRSQLVGEVSLPNLQSLYTLNGDFLKAECLHKFTNLRKLGICCCMKQFASVLTDAKPISEKLENLQLKVWDDGPYRVRESFFVEIPVFVEIPESSASTTSDSQNPRAPESPPLNFSGYQNLHNLYLEGPLVVVPEFTTRLTKLTLVGSVLVQDPMEELGKLPNLRKLQLRQGTYMGFKMVISGAGRFPLLEVLTIETMPLMKALKVEGGVMPKLRCVKINCDITLEIHSERLRNIFRKFNDHLMSMSYLELDVEFALPEDDFVFHFDEDDSLSQSSMVDNKGRK